MAFSNLNNPRKDMEDLSDYSDSLSLGSIKVEDIVPEERFGDCSYAYVDEDDSLDDNEESPLFEEASSLVPSDSSSQVSGSQDDSVANLSSSINQVDYSTTTTGDSAFHSDSLQEDSSESYSETDPDNNEAMGMTEDELKYKLLIAEAESQGAASVVKKHNRENKHLKSLHYIKMESLLLSAPPPGPAEDLVCFTDSQTDLDYYELPAPEQTKHHRINSEGDEVHGGIQEKIIRDELWNVHLDPPVMKTPSRMFIIDQLDFSYSNAINVLSASEIVGLSCEGRSLGHRGQLCWILMCTQDQLFMFDCLALGESVFSSGLRNIIECKEIIKVCHDIRYITLCFHHQFGLEIKNPVDTMIADLTYCSQRVHDGFIPATYRSLQVCLKQYLGVADHHIFFPRYRLAYRDQDTMIWESRPLPQHLVVGAARNCLYLLPLFRIINKGLMTGLHCIMRRINKSEGRQEVEVGDLLPQWKMRQSRQPSEYTVDGDYVHPNVASVDPHCVFSKDSVHQTFQP